MGSDGSQLSNEHDLVQSPSTTKENKALDPLHISDEGEERKGEVTVCKPFIRVAVERLRQVVHLSDDMWDEPPKTVLDAWLLHPQSTLRLYWDAMVLIALGTILVVLPVSIAFNYSDNGNSWLGFYAFTDALFTWDILMNFRTGICMQDNKHIILCSSNQVARKYARTWLPVDFLGVFPLHYIFYAYSRTMGTDYSEGSIVTAFRLAKIFELAKLMRLSQVQRYFATWGKFVDVTGSVIGYVKLLAAMFLLCHWNACLTYFLPALQGFPDKSWVILGNLMDKSWFEIYTNSLYKTVSNMITTGYGAYTPITTPEVLVMIWCMISQCVLYAVFTGFTIQNINKYNLSDKAFQTRMLEVQDYIVARRLPSKLERKIKDYYEQRFNGKLFDEQAIFGEMSEALKLEILNHTSRAVISEIPIFRSAESNFVNDMVRALQQEMFQSGDVIIKAGSKAAAKMYFIREGVLEILTKKGDFLKNVQRGSYFGEIAMLTSLPRTATVRAVTNAKLLSLTRESFQVIFGDHPYMKKALAIIASKRLHSLVEDVHMDRETLFIHLHAVHAVINESSGSRAAGPGSWQSRRGSTDSAGSALRQ